MIVVTRLERNVFDVGQVDEHASPVHELGEVVGPLPVGLCVATVPDGRVVWANSVFEAIIGRPPSPTVCLCDAASLYQVYDRSGRLYPAERFPYAVVLRTSAPATADDVVIHRPGGAKAFLRVYARPVFDVDGKLFRVSIAFVDVTQQVRAESEREHTGIQLKLALEHAPIIVWAVSLDGDVTTAQGAGLLGLESRGGRLIGKNLFQVFPNEQAAIRRILYRAFRGDSFKTVGRLAGTTLDTWVGPSYGASGDVVGANGVSQDIGALRQLELVAMQVNRTKAIGVLSASVAHEINNPLTYMLPCCDYVAMAVDQLLHGLEQVRDEGARALVPTVRQLAEDIAVLQGGMQRIATIANDLRSFAHTSDERAGAVDTAAVVRAVLQLIGKEAARRVHLSVSLGATMTAFGHPSRLIQVVLNLVANALHATARLPKCAAMIVIRTADDGERVRLEVLDSGHGVPPAQRDRIFEPFVTTKVSGDGSGLGLFVSRNIVEQHGGTLTVHEGELGGALFRVGLARYRSRLEEALVSEQSGIEAVKASVLVVDDEPAVGAVLVRQLEKHRHKAIWLDGVAAAVSQVQLSEFDLVFCDLMMEDVEGKPWYEFLARAWPGVQRRLVVMTGGAFSPLAREFAIRNVDRLVEKPFDIAAEVSRRMLDRRAEIET